MTITFGSVCSGIEAASVAWHPLGWETAWLAEIEKAPAAVLAHHYPQTWDMGDMTAIAPQIRAGSMPAPDVLVGGTPCQAFSVAGLRNSLSDARGQLTLSFVDLANAIDEQRDEPCIVVWENVPGVLNTKDNAFGCFLAALAGEDEALVPAGGKWSNAGCVYGPQRAIAWRVLDAQYFGVAQRRRRVFVVASARDGFDPATVLFECESLRRDSPPSRGQGQETAGTIASRSTGGGFPGTDEACSGYLSVVHGGDRPPRADVDNLDSLQVVTHCREVAGAITSNYGKQVDNSDTALGPNVIAFHSNAQPDQMRFDPALSASLTCSQNAAVCITGASEDGTGRGQPIVTCDVVGAMSAAGGTAKKHGFGWGQQDFENGYCQPYAAAVRRLTPTECERLQGFPDSYTQVPYRGKPMADGPRYKMLGNSMAVPCMAWIGRRIDAALRSAHNAP